MASIWALRLLAIFIAFACVAYGFNCPSLPATPPATSVFDLRPSDIRVVMALGDSITAGFGIKGASGGLYEYRGDSWCIGADNGTVSVFNFIKFYNDSVVGGSLGDHIVEVCVDPICPNGTYIPAQDVLNAAQSGAQLDDLITHETDYLLNQLNKIPDIDVANDWKLLTLFIGANDLCSVCLSTNPNSEPDNWQNGITALLEKIRGSVPRVFVNLVPMFNLSGVYFLSKQNTYCEDVHSEIDECPCMFAPSSPDVRTQVDIITQEVNARLYEIEALYRAKNYTDFAAIVQPFGQDTNITTLPFSFLSTLDCFHPSLEAHQAMAVALWNNMMTPAGEKKTKINYDDTPICPTVDTLLYTN